MTYLQDETRKISMLTQLAHGSMNNCKTQIESLLKDLENELNQ